MVIITHIKTYNTIHEIQNKKKDKGTRCTVKIMTISATTTLKSYLMFSFVVKRTWTLNRLLWIEFIKSYYEMYFFVTILFDDKGDFRRPRFYGTPCMNECVCIKESERERSRDIDMWRWVDVNGMTRGKPLDQLGSAQTNI